MKPTSKLRHFLLTARLAFPLAATLMAAAPAHAAIVVTTNSQGFVNNGLGTHIGTIQASTTDLLQTDLASTSANLFGGSAAAMYTGIISNVDSATTIAKAESGRFINFNLDITTNTLGYDITQIDVFSFNGDARATQGWSVFVKEVGSPTFTLLQSINGLGASGQVNRVRLTDNADPVLGNIATGIESIRFEFVTNSAMLTWRAYREIDIIGSATISGFSAIPEPTTALAGLLLAAGLLRRRR